MTHRFWVIHRRTGLVEMNADGGHLPGLLQPGILNDVAVWRLTFEGECPPLLLGFDARSAQAIVDTHGCLLMRMEPFLFYSSMCYGCFASIIQ